VSVGSAAVEPGQSRLRLGVPIVLKIVFFDTEAGQTDEVAPPTGMSFGEATVCWNDAAWIGALGSVPVLIEKATAIPTPAQVRVSHLCHGRIIAGANLPISAAFATSLAVTGASCRNGVDCGTMQSEALKLAERVDAGSPDRGAISDSTANVPQRLGDLASRTLELDRLHAFEDSSLSPYYGTFASTQLLALNGTGGEGLAVNSPGFWGCCEVAGYLVGIWRAAGNALEPLASFELVRQRGKVVSVKVDQP
jgi:hypothetical protein